MTYKETDNLSTLKVGDTVREHCEFKNAPCNYTGIGWYDRCVWCKDNNGFIRQKEDDKKPF